VGGNVGRPLACEEGVSSFGQDGCPVGTVKFEPGTRHLELKRLNAARGV
jgi:hypothetical protein